MALHPDLQADAERVLDEAGYVHEQIVAVEGDSILYVNKCGQARTCWLDRKENGKLRVLMEEGFQAEPPPGWHTAPMRF